MDAVRTNGSSVTINVAGRDGVRAGENCPASGSATRASPAERKRGWLQQSVIQRKWPQLSPASRLSAGGDSSIAAILAEGAITGRQRIIYTAENDNFAAEKLSKEVANRSSGRDLSGLQVLNTVIGKMSGVISSEREMRELGLSPLVPGFNKCVLVEEFNRILVSRVTLPGFVRGIRVFEEKTDLLPFEEAKLHGHNAIHALLGYLARLQGPFGDEHHQAGLCTPFPGWTGIPGRIRGSAREKTRGSGRWRAAFYASRLVPHMPRTSSSA